jgi:3',5'-cyclic AMP phosphodiesterase CpdA
VENTGKVVAKIALISDTHITSYRNLLLPMVARINAEPVDMVIATGDMANDSTRQTLELARVTLDKITHPVFVIPGDYDNGPCWQELFGGNYKSTELGGYALDFLDTSFMGHSFSVGWGDVIDAEDKDQSEWLNNQFNSTIGPHLVFSHHPMFVKDTPDSRHYRNNLCAAYAGHLHSSFKYLFKHMHPVTKVETGFISVPMVYHGSACYMVILIKDTGEIISIPRVVEGKTTKW